MMIVWGAVTCLCAVFSFIYAQFSHGVSSQYMTFLCVIPLICGLAVPSILHLLHAGDPGRVAYNAYNSGVASLIVASALEGIVEIAGTSSIYIRPLAIVGLGFIIFAAVAFAWHHVQRNDRWF